MRDLAAIVISNRLAARVRELRKAAGISQAVLATRMKTHRPLICRAELGTHELTISWVCRTARALGVKPSEILCVLDEPFPEPESEPTSDLANKEGGLDW